MEFGEWLRKQHQNRKLDVRTMAEMSRVDPSTISRIENLHTQSTLYTAYRICNGLHITSSELYYELTASNMLVPKQASNNNEHIIRLSDIEMLLSALGSNKKDIYHYFATALNEISMLINKDVEEHSVIYPQFTPEIVEAFLAQTYRSTFQFDLHYPRAIASDTIIYNYEQGGVVLLNDVGAYARNLRKSKKETLKSIRSYTEISTSVLSRLEDGALERIKLADILTLDNALDAPGVLLDMCWDFCQFDELIDDNLSEMYKTNRSFINENARSLTTRAKYIILLYVKVCRWFQHLQGPTTAWHKYSFF